MSWLRANWKVLVTVALLMGTVTGWVSAARYMGIADTEAALAARQNSVILERDIEIVAAEERSAELAADLAERRSADSTRVVELEDAREALEQAGDSLVALARESAEETGTVTIELFEEAVVTLQRDVELADSLRNVERVGRLRAEANECAGCAQRILLFEPQLQDLRDLVATKDREIDALRNAASPSFGIRLKADWWMAVGGFVIGMVVTR